MLGEAFLADLYAAWEENGATVIQRVVDEQPGLFLKVIANLLPKDLNLNANPVENLSDEELVRRVRILLKVNGPYMEAIEQSAKANIDH